MKYCPNPPCNRIIKTNFKIQNEIRLKNEERFEENNDSRIKKRMENDNEFLKKWRMIKKRA